MKSGDVHPDRTPEQFQRAMVACELAVGRLNILISEACDEAEALKQLEAPNFQEMVRMTTTAIEHARQIRETVTRSRTKAVPSNLASRPFAPSPDRPQPTAD
jgi:hypothetical protein